jgi:hypothetical protein
MRFRHVLFGLFMLVFAGQLLAVARFALMILFGLASAASVEALVVDGLKLVIDAGLIWAALLGLRALVRRVPKRGN